MIPRVIPCLLMQDKGLVKTVQFGSPTYIGDPINAVRIFNEMEADELMILDIYASKNGKGIDWDILDEITKEAFMPLCYGGGISSDAEVEKLFRLGIEKVSINTSAINNPGLISKIADKFGSQSVMVTLDVCLCNDSYFVYDHIKEKVTTLELDTALEKAVNHGAGEITINNVNKDGTMSGYDLQLLKRVTKQVTIPVVACGGCGSLEHMKQAVEYGGVSAVSAGSLFVYWGRLKGILINYPKRETLLNIFQ